MWCGNSAASDKTNTLPPPCADSHGLGEENYIKHLFGGLPLGSMGVPRPGKKDVGWLPLTPPLPPLRRHPPFGLLFLVTPGPPAFYSNPVGSQAASERVIPPMSRETEKGGKQRKQQVGGYSLEEAIFGKCPTFFPPQFWRKKIIKLDPATHPPTRWDGERVVLKEAGEGEGVSDVVVLPGHPAAVVVVLREAAGEQLLHQHEQPCDGRGGGDSGRRGGGGLSEIVIGMQKKINLPQKIKK